MVMINNHCMEVLLTGGHGAIGKFALKELMERGHDVTVFDISGGGGFQESLPTEYSWIKGDITDSSAVNDATEGHDAILHLAALKRSACEENPKKAQEVNIGGTINIFDAGVNNDARVVHASTKSVFGHVAGNYAYPMYEPLDESAPKSATGDIYGLTKAATESYRKNYDRKRDLDVASVRYGSSYGPGKIAVPGKGTLISDLIKSAMDGDAKKLSGGDELNDWVYFDDIARGLVDAVETETLGYPVYHIGTGRLNSLNDFARILVEAFPQADITIEDGRNPQNRDHPMYAKMDISRAVSDLDYQPKYTLRDGLKHYLDQLDSDHNLS